MGGSSAPSHGAQSAGRLHTGGGTLSCSVHFSSTGFASATCCEASSMTGQSSGRASMTGQLGGRASVIGQSGGRAGVTS